MKNIICFLLFSSFAFAGNINYVNEVLADSPVAYWRLDEETGSVVQDFSGNNLNGSYQGGVNQSTSGIFPGNSAAGFDGINDHVDLSPAVSSLANQTEGTLEMWLKLDGSEGITALMFSDPPTGTNSDRKRWFLVFRSTAQGGHINIESNNQLAFYRSDDSAYPVNEFFHFAVTSTGQMYINGQEINAFFTAGNLSNLWWSDNPNSNEFSDLSLMKFEFVQGSTAFSPGAIDEVAIYDSVLSQERIQSHFAAATNEDSVIPEPSTYLLLLFSLAFVGISKKQS